MNYKQTTVIVVATLLIAYFILNPFTELVAGLYRITEVALWRETGTLIAVIVVFGGLITYHLRDKDANSRTDSRSK